MGWDHRHIEVNWIFLFVEVMMLSLDRELSFLSCRTSHCLPQTGYNHRKICIIKIHIIFHKYNHISVFLTLEKSIKKKVLKRILKPASVSFNLQIDNTCIGTSDTCILPLSIYRNILFFSVS